MMPPPSPRHRSPLPLKVSQPSVMQTMAPAAPCASCPWHHEYRIGPAAVTHWTDIGEDDVVCVGEVL